MTSKETEQLLKNELTDTQERRKTNTRRRFVILCILDALFFQTIAMLGYIVNEWTQNTLKLKYFPRGDFSGQNISSCVNNSDSNEKYELYAKVQQETAHWAMYNNIAQQTTACVACVLLSCYTDTYGRKFLFILSTLSVVIRTGTICVVMYLKQSFVFVVGAYAIEGVLGSCFAFITASFLVVADIFPEKKARVLAVISVEANLLFSVMMSGLVSGILADKFGFLLTTLICLSMAILSFILAIFLLPETLRSDHRSRPPSIFEALKRPFQFYTSSTFAERRLEYILLILAFGFGQLGVSLRSSIETVYLLGMPFCWTPTRIGYFELVRFAGQIFIGLVSVKILQKFMSNKAIAIISTVFCFASYIVEAFARSELTFYMVAVIAMLGFTMIPMTRGVISTITPPDKQGSVFASISAVEIITNLLASVTENSIYAATVSVVNGFVFLAMAGYIFIDFLLLSLYSCITMKRKKYESKEAKK